jgi:hypothetical protein
LKVCLIIILLISNICSAQSQRLILVEEFSNASCGPCAAQNPGFNNLLSANSAKVAQIKYQTSWPGIDPMNAEAQNLGINDRVIYYGVNGVPVSFLDGNSYGSPSNISQSTIDYLYAIQSSFDLNAIHSFSSNGDSVNVSINITCTQSIAVQDLKCRIAVTEHEIDFCAPPGSNGEYAFTGVLRSMFPDANGIPVSNNWTSGQTQSTNFSFPMPDFINDKNQIDVVVFLQDDGNKSILQAAVSNHFNISNDACIFDCTTPDIYSCDSVISANLILKNCGSDTLTSCNINWKVNNGIVDSQAWSGNLAPGDSTPVIVTGINILPGSDTIELFTSNPNGHIVHITESNKKQLLINLLSSPVTFSYTENFNGTFPPPYWTVEDVVGTYGAGSHTWEWDTCGFNSSGSAKMYLMYEQVHNINTLYMPLIDLTLASPGISLLFQMAYAYYSGLGAGDLLMVQVSSDCGSTWQSLYSKGSSTMVTDTVPWGIYFTPTNSSQWHQISIPLNHYVGQKIFIRFKTISGTSGTLYLDDVEITDNITRTEDISTASRINIYPNPATGIIYINTKPEYNCSISVINTFGSSMKVNSILSFTPGLYGVDVSNLQSGNYFIKINTGYDLIIKNVFVTKY